MLGMFFSFFASPPRAPVEFSEFLSMLKEGKVESAELMGNGYEVQAKLKKANKEGFEYISVMYRPDMEPGPESYLLEYNIPFASEKPNGTGVWGMLFMVLPYLVLFMLMIYFFNRMSDSGGGQAFSFGKSRHTLADEKDVKVRFDDVAGIEEAKEELTEVVDYLKYPEKYQRLGARIPRGILMVGAPGTGKTLLARAVAGEAEVPFYFISGSDFVEMFVGVGASRVRDLFEQAKKTEPCIIFIDEIDAVGRKRGAGFGGGHDEREQTLNQLLVAMDGFENEDSVIVIAATNRPDVLDPALLRPGRFDRRVVVDRPDIKGRLAILKVHSKGKPLGPDVDLDALAKRTVSFSGADLENLLNEAALQAARKGHDVILMDDCEEAIDRIQMGPEKKSRVTKVEDKKKTAYHEAGHALVAWQLEDADRVTKVTVLPRGMALGVTNIVPDEDRYSYSKEQLLSKICVFMGGRAAEEIIYNQITTGASNDIERATQLAREMVTRYGMSDLGPVNYTSGDDEVFLGRDFHQAKTFSEGTAQEIDSAVQTIMNDEYTRAYNILTEYQSDLESITSLLVERETIDGYELQRILGPAKGKAPVPDPVPSEAEVESSTATTVAQEQEQPDSNSDASEASEEA